MSESKPTLSVSFHNFNRSGYAFFLKALGERFDVKETDAGRDLQISTVFGEDPPPHIPGHRPLRVWWTGEPRDPKATIYDLHFGFQHTSVLGKRWFRYPFWNQRLDWWDADSPWSPAQALKPRRFVEKPKFCSFITTNSPSIRREFFLRLDALQPVDSLGRFYNNRNRYLGAHREFMSALGEYRFNIAFENQTFPGYVTEKVMQPLIMGSIPIYWGTPEVERDFNKRAFICAMDFADLQELAQHIVALDRDHNRMAEMAAEPVFANNTIPYEYTPQFFVDRVSEALSSGGAGRVPQHWNLTSIADFLKQG